jgi:hypothetical protein
MRHVATAATGLALAALLLGLFFWRTDWRALSEALRHANPLWVVAASGLAVGSFAFRALRWHWLLLPVGNSAFAARMRALIEGYAVTNLMPGRMGELVRPYLLSRDASLSFASVLATVVVERVMDMTTLLAFLGFFFSWHAEVLPTEGLRRSFQASGIAMVVAAAALGGVMYWVARRPEPASRHLTKLLGFLPARWAVVLESGARNFILGFGILARPAAFPALMGYSVLTWLSICGYFWMSMHAAGLEADFFSTLLFVPMAAVGISIPTPGGIGGYHAVLQVGLVDIYGLPAGPAALAILLSHAVSYVPVSVLGAAGLSRRGLSWKKAVRMAEDAAPESPASGFIPPR